MNIIFDLDGTLIDSAPDIHAAANAVLAAEGLAPSHAGSKRAALSAMARVSLSNGWNARVPGRTTMARTDRMHAQFLAQYETAHALTRPYPGVDAAAGQLSRAWLGPWAVHEQALETCAGGSGPFRMDRPIRRGDRRG
jgi:phosphoglycolate phosphatase